MRRFPHAAQFSVANLEDSQRFRLSSVTSDSFPICSSSDPPLSEISCVTATLATDSGGWRIRKLPCFDARLIFD